MSGDMGLAVITGGSSGIGYELARLAAESGRDLLIAAQTGPKLEEAARNLRERGVQVRTVACDLATMEGVDSLMEAVDGQPVDILCANAGHGLGGAFLDQEWDDIRHVIDTNITGTAYLLHHVGRLMREQGYGRILITGSIAGTMPAPTMRSITRPRPSWTTSPPPSAASWRTAASASPI